MWLLSIGLLLTCFVGVSLAINSDVNATADPVWHLYKQNFSKTYQHASEDQTRREIWKRQLEYVQEHNERYRLGLETFTVEVNKFSDYTMEELSKLTGARVDNRTAYSSELQNISHHIESFGNVGIPDRVDWRRNGIVTGVKNQGDCGSCWTFSVTGAVESFHARTTGRLVRLSEQNLLECVGPTCSGYDPMKGFNYAATRGIDTEQSYPYTSKNRRIGQCHYNARNVGAKIQKYGRVKEGDEGQLAWAIATYGPVSVTINAKHDTFFGYKSGIYYERACSTTNLDHSVLAVGYGPGYYIIKNSWGTQWGTEGGYMYLARNRGNHCGVASYAAVPTA